MKKRFIALFLIAIGFGSFFFLHRVGAAAEVKKTNIFTKILRRVVQDIEFVEQGIRRAVTGVGEVITAPFRNNIKIKQPSIARNPYAYIQAKVRSGAPESPEEQQYLRLRRPLARKALEKFLGTTFPKDIELPDIMISLSGGGNRSTILSWGFLRAMEMIGILDCVSHISSLSGSTWMLFPWLASGLSLEQYKERLLSSVTHGPQFRSPENIKHSVDYILSRLAFKRSITIIDFYGIGLGTILLNGLGEGGDPLQVYMDSLSKVVKTALVPYPILTSISVPDVRWFTATPHEFGSASLGQYIPVWALDRDFSNGVSVEMSPYPARVGLSNFLAMSAAAVGLSFGDFYYNSFSSMKDGIVKNILNAILKKSPLERMRFLYYEKRNFLKGMKGLPIYDEFKGKTWGDVEKIKYTDAGVIWGNPFPPLLNRMRPGVPTIMLVMDASGTISLEKLGESKEFADGQNARKKIFPFPNVSAVEGLTKKSMSVLKNNDVLMLYFPRVIDKDMLEMHNENPEFKELIGHLQFDMNERMHDEYSTFNLKYSREGVQDLVALSLFNVLANKESIKSTIKNYLDQYIQRELLKEKELLNMIAA